MFWNLCLLSIKCKWTVLWCENNSKSEAGAFWKLFKRGSIVVDFLFIVTPIVGVCNCSMFCCTLLYVHSSIAIILMGKRELVALLNLSSWCLVMVEWPFLAVSWGCLWFVIVVFPDHTRLLFFILHAYFCKLGVLTQWSGRRLQHIDFIWTLD